MSGAAALASARRRRAAPQGTTNNTSSQSQNRGGPTQLRRPPAPPSNNDFSEIDSLQNTTQGTTTNQRVNPTVMLLNHNRIIENLQKVLSNLNENVEKNLLTKEDLIELIERMSKEEIEKLRVSQDNIEFFKNKYTKMENQLNELKKHIIKVQTFAMETSLQTIELKKKIFREQSFKNMDQVSKSDIHKLDASPEANKEQIERLRNNTELNEILNEGTGEISS